MDDTPSDLFNLQVDISVGEYLDSDSLNNGDVLLETRHILDAVTDHKNLQTIYDTVDNMDMDLNHTIDSNHDLHQHLDEAMDEGSSKRKRPLSYEGRLKSSKSKSKYIVPWSYRKTNLFLVTWNFVMLTLYSFTHILDGMPPSVKYIIGVFHVLAIGLYLYDVALHIFKRKARPIHNV